METRHAKVKIGKAVIYVELADTPFTRAKGLMFRSSLEENRGMLFVFDKEGRYSMWMLGMRFPIDIIWIDKDMRVVDIVKNADPSLLLYKTYRPIRKAKYVLEVRAGFTKEYDVKLGSKIIVKFRFRNKKI